MEKWFPEERKIRKESFAKKISQIWSISVNIYSRELSFSLYYGRNFICPKCQYSQFYSLTVRIRDSYSIKLFLKKKKKNCFLKYVRWNEVNLAKLLGWKEVE